MKIELIKSKLKKDKEFLIQFDSNPNYHRVIVAKTTYEIKNHKSTDTFIAKLCDSDELVDFLLICITDIKEPITNTEMFTMWTNWNSMKRIDPNFADETKNSIKNTLIDRSYVKFGSGKFELYDFNKMREFI